MNDAGTDFRADLSNGRKLERVGEHYIVTFDNGTPSVAPQPESLDNNLQLLSA